MSQSKTILLVEDDAILSDAFKLSLEKNNYFVHTAPNGQAALELLEKQPIDVILLDLLMPVMDGKEFLRAFDNTDDIPVIVFSNLDDKSTIKEVLSLGATRYMLKSWASPKELVKIIQSVS